MKKTLLATIVILSTATSMASEFEYEFINEIPEITISGEAATKLNCTLSSNPLARIQKIQIDIREKSAKLSSLLLGTSESETECSRKANSVICNGDAFDIIIDNILASPSGTNLKAEYKNYGIFGVSEKSISCHLR